MTNNHPHGLLLARSAQRTLPGVLHCLTAHMPLADPDYLSAGQVLCSCPSATVVPTHNAHHGALLPVRASVAPCGLGAGPELCSWPALHTPCSNLGSLPSMLCTKWSPTRPEAWALCYPRWHLYPTGHLCPPDRSCLMRPLLALGSTGRKSLNQVISGSGFPLAAQSMVAVRVRSTTFSWGPMSMLGKPGGSWSSGGVQTGKRGQESGYCRETPLGWA